MRRTLTRIALVATAAAILRVNSEAASTLTANPTSDQEFPAPAIPLTSTGAPRPFAFGTATFTLNDAMTSLAFTATIFNLDLSGIQTPNNFHTTQFPGGEIRGAIVLNVPDGGSAAASNYALEFDGTDDRVQAGTGLFPGITNNFTIELWANPTGLRTLTAEANTGVSALAQRFAVFPEHGDSSYGAGHAGAGLSIGFNGISVFEHAHDHLPSLLVYPDAISGWTHVALVYANHTPQLYVNGTLVRTGLTSAIPFIHPSASLGTWAIDYGTYQGELDEVRIWDAPLSQAQIRANMNRSLAGDEPNLVLYYRCDEGTGVVVVDHAPAAPSADGTLIVSGGVTNGPVWVPSEIQPFSPFAETLPATATGDFTNRLNGLFNPVGADTRVWFEWGTNINYGNLTPARAIGSGTANTNWSEVFGGLENNVTYHFRAAAANAFGVALGSNLNFTTRFTCNYTVIIPPGLSLIANQCANANDVGTLMPAVPAGTRLLKFNNASQTFEMLNTFNGTSWTFPSQTLGLGEGAWIYNPGPGVFTLAFRGTVAGDGVQALGSACYLVSRQLAAPGHYADIVAGAPPGGATIFNFDPVAQSYQIEIYDALEESWLPSFSPAEVGEALWICPTGGAPPLLPAPCAATITPGVGTVTITWPCAGCHLEQVPALLTPSATTKWTFIPASSPAVLTATGSAMFYQVVCP